MVAEPTYLAPGVALKDRYTIADELGRGGFSIVYRARDCSVGPEVAIKRLVPPPAAARLARERLRREVQAVRQLSHPNIVAVYDVVDDGPWSFVVMEYVAGPDLAVRLRQRGPLDPDAAARLGREITAALAAAHRHGILHRDVKPQNILLAPDGRARLTDFGSARLAGQETVTQTGGLVGTADYAAPEQLAAGAAMRGRTNTPWASRCTTPSRVSCLLEFPPAAPLPAVTATILGGGAPSFPPGWTRSWGGPRCRIPTTGFPPSRSWQMRSSGGSKGGPGERLRGLRTRRAVGGAAPPSGSPWRGVRP